MSDTTNITNTTDILQAKYNMVQSAMQLFVQSVRDAYPVGSLIKAKWGPHGVFAGTVKEVRDDGMIMIDPGNGRTPKSRSFKDVITNDSENA